MRAVRWCIAAIAAVTSATPAAAAAGPVSAAPTRVDTDVSGIPDRTTATYLEKLSATGRYVLLRVESHSNLVPQRYRTAHYQMRYLLRKDLQTGKLD